MSKYQELRQILAAEIAAGRYPPGSRFPTDHELCDRFGVSRHTVRDAIRDLQRRGTLARRRGSGTLVSALLEGPGAWVLAGQGGGFDDQPGGHFERRYEGRVTAHPALAEFLGCTAGDSWRRTAGLIRGAASSRPLCWTEVYLDGARSRMPFDDLVQLRFPAATECQQEIRAVAIAPDQALAMEAIPHSPGLLVIYRPFSATRQLLAVVFRLYAAGQPAPRLAFSRIEP